MTRLVIVGSVNNSTVIDGNGALLKSDSPSTDAIIVSSDRSQETGLYTVPQDIVIKNFRVDGSVRLIGMGKNGQAPRVRESSRSLGHTERAQDAAPKRIVFENIHINGIGRIPFYVGPGCTEITLRNCTITGNSLSTAVYLDCESAYNTIESNKINVKTRYREVIAIDGSAHNTIASNQIERSTWGGIYLYRNSGEGGTIRHQTPQFNVVSENHFSYSQNNVFGNIWRQVFPSIWVGSRSHWLTSLVRHRYRNDDAGYGFGSSTDNRDNALNNTIRDNSPANSIKIRAFYSYRE